MAMVSQCRCTLGLLVVATVLLCFYISLRKDSIGLAYDVRMLKLRKSTDVSLSNADLTQTVFVTAADSSHFEESKDSIASLQKNLAVTHKILFYDLGLKQTEVEEVQTWCRVIYRKFRFDDYPAHVRKMQAYAWKVILVNNILQEYNAVAWFDASMRFKCPNFMDQLEPTLRKSGVVMTDNAGHSTFAVTHPNMYKYLPKNITLLQKTPQLGSCFFIIVNTTRVIEKIMKPWVKCGLIEDCTFAGRKWPCHFGKDRFTRYAGCHRPQSALNILLLEEHKGDLSMYHANGTCVHITRSPTSMFKLQKCQR